ncbi:hypothetical protein P3L10_026203 [Capsicum annuum]|uniref:uncharacterized protein LOC124887397 n=1 Tax=Capsicum annuum TaxID=4072 RepID=UPI001FB1637B|nr:uncharacterized protein LOC124887397 [Capsicum annuum]
MTWLFLDDIRIILRPTDNQYLVKLLFEMMILYLYFFAPLKSLVIALIYRRLTCMHVWNIPLLLKNPRIINLIFEFNDCRFTLTQLTEIVNNNDDIQGELDSDEPLQYESSDDDQSSDDEDDNNDENVNGESTLVGVYTGNHSFIAVSYLDHTEESPEELRCMVNEDYFRTPL